MKHDKKIVEDNKKFFKVRKGEAGVIVTAVLLVIAVGLLITFKGSITEWLTDINANITAKVTTLLS